jgi:hypothetical protein
MVPEMPPGRRRQRQRGGVGSSGPADPEGSARPDSTDSGPRSDAASEDSGRGGGHHKAPERASEGRDSDRGWRELAGSSPSQVGVDGALRARDVARPSDADLEAAERDLVIVRRDWQPPTPELPTPIRRKN